MWADAHVARQIPNLSHFPSGAECGMDCKFHTEESVILFAVLETPDGITTAIERLFYYS
jgi:hypothetical protein